MIDLRLGDCLDPVGGMASLADLSVDVTITDPPYAKDLYRRMRTNDGAIKTPRDMQSSRDMANLRIGHIDDILPEVASHIARVTRRWILVFGDVEHAQPRWRAAFPGDWYVRAGVWVKTAPMPQVSGDRPAQGFELVSIFHRPGKKRWNGGGRAGTWIECPARGKARHGHPCPKPLKLMARLVADFTDPGELILDPFSGVATTAVAAVSQGRRFVGWERDPEYHASAMNRLAASQLDMTGTAQ